MAAPPSRKAPTVINLARGGLTMSVPAARVIDYRVWGHFDMELADRMLELVEQELEQGGDGFVAFHDWGEMTGYETRARLRLTAWVLKYRARFEGIHILSGSSLVSMGVTVANMALGQFMTWYGAADRARYTAAQREALSKTSGPVSVGSRFPPPSSRFPPPSRSIPPPPNSVPPPPSRKY